MKEISVKQLSFALEGLCIAGMGLIILTLSGIFPSCAIWLFAICFVVTAVLIWVRALLTLSTPGLLLTLFSALVYLVAGIVLFTEHNADMNYVMNYLAIIFFIVAITNLLITAFRLRTKNWGFLLISALISIAIAALLLVQQRDSLMWTTSILFGGHFIVYGACQLMTGFTDWFMAPKA